MIDWTRMAKPQADGYDSAVIAERLRERRGWVKAVPPQGVATLISGRVAVAPDPFAHGATGIMQDAFADVTAGELAEVDRYLSAWPDGYSMVGQLLDEFWPKRFANSVGRGSSSGHHPMSSWNEGFKRTVVYVTVSDPEGCATGIYHEVGHLRLEALGMDIDDHDGTLILNPSTDGFHSPVRKFDEIVDEAGNTIRVPILRPMCAVIHGLYAWMLIMEADLWCAATISATDAAHYIRDNVPKVEEGIREVERYVTTTVDGAIFVASMLDWAKDITIRGRALLEPD